MKALDMFDLDNGAALLSRLHRFTSNRESGLTMVDVTPGDDELLGCADDLKELVAQVVGTTPVVSVGALPEYIEVSFSCVASSSTTDAQTPEVEDDPLRQHLGGLQYDARRGLGSTAAARPAHGAADASQRILQDYHKTVQAVAKAAIYVPDAASHHKLLDDEEEREDAELASTYLNRPAGPHPGGPGRRGAPDKSHKSSKKGGGATRSRTLSISLPSGYHFSQFSASSDDQGGHPGKRPRSNSHAVLDPGALRRAPSDSFSVVDPSAVLVHDEPDEAYDPLLDEHGRRYPGVGMLHGRQAPPVRRASARRQPAPTTRRAASNPSSGRGWKKRVKYDVRKNFADSRLRVKGRFVKKVDEQILRDMLRLV